jgi:4-aminobutyrate aminotransferase-like enzyme
MGSACRLPGRAAWRAARDEGRAMHDYDVFSVESKAEVLAKSREFWNPGKTDFWSESGVDLVIDRREGYFIWDMSGLRLIDVHLNGGTFNLGHRRWSGRPRRT